MQTLLFWLYLMNAVLLIDHEIDSAYWKEWELLHLPGGIAGFLLIHVPLLFMILYGAVLIDRQAFSGLILSLVLAAGGLFAFSIHTFFLRRGRPEFDTLMSKAILYATLLVSVAQFVVTLSVIFCAGRL